MTCDSCDRPPIVLGSVRPRNDLWRFNACQYAELNLPSVSSEEFTRVVLACNDNADWQKYAAGFYPGCNLFAWVHSLLVFWGGFAMTLAIIYSNFDEKTARVIVGAYLIFSIGTF